MLGREVHVDVHLLDAHDAFDGMQAGTEHEGVLGAHAGAALLHGEFAVPLAGGEAEPDQQPPRTLDAQRVEQLLAQFGE